MYRLVPSALYLDQVRLLPSKTECDSRLPVAVETGKECQSLSKLSALSNADLLPYACHNRL